MTGMKRMLAVLAAVTCIAQMTGCAEKKDPAESSTASQETESSTESADETEAAAETAATSESSAEKSSLSKADLNTAWGDDAVTLAFSGDSVTPSSEDGLTVQDGVVTITKGGDYVLSGTLNDGRIVVSLADKQEKAHLIFNGLSVTCSTGAPLTVLQADKTVITLAEGTKNTLTDAKEYTVFDITEAENQYPNACIASKDDLTINGSGTLHVSANYNNGIHCSDDLKLVSGEITVDAVNHGIRGNDSVLIHDGKITVTSGGDGIKSSTADQDGKGYIQIEGGTVTVNAEQDGIDAATALTVTAGTLDLTAGGGTANAAAHADDMGGFGFGGGMHGGKGRGDFGDFNHFGDFGGREDASSSAADPLAFTGDVNKSAEESESADSTAPSTKGMKAAQTLTVTGGSITVNSADDAVHADDTVQISGSAKLTLAAGDDGIHADSSIKIDGGEIEITESYEGIEAAEITVNDGTVHLKSSDDGFNASDGSGGGMGFNRNGSGELNLNGGYVYVNADGDGVDSNGNITMKGGTVIVCGPTDSANGPLDSGDNNNTITVTGGTLIAVGSTGMMEVPESNYIAATNLNAAAGTLIVVTDEKENVLAALKTPKQAQGIAFSANGMSDGYKVYTGGTYDGTFNADNFAQGGSYSGGTLVTSGSGGAEGMGGFGGMHGGRQDGFKGDMTPPDGFDGNMTPPDGFDGNMTPPDGFDGNMTPPDGFDGNMTPPDGNFGGRGHGGRGNRAAESQSDT